MLAVLGFFLMKRDAKKGRRSSEEEVLSQKTVENVAALNDRFNRARYQEEDKKSETSTHYGSELLQDPSLSVSECYAGGTGE